MDTSFDFGSFGLVILCWIINSISDVTANILINQASPKEYCEFETLKASCAADEVIMMTHAKYGRMNLGRCVQADLGYVGCSSDVLDLADRLCSGRRQCEIQIPNKAMKTRKLGARQQSCFKELTSYLEASYRCQKVTNINQSQCRSYDFVRVTKPSGILPSVLSKESTCGTTECPWRITVPTGQRINMTLVNFAWSPMSDIHATSRYEIANCQVLATVRENTKAKPKTICSRLEKESTIYTSLTNSVEIRITPNRMEGPSPIYFLLKYEAIGCQDPGIPLAGWVERKGDVSTLGCNESDTSVQWTCKNGKWEGKEIVCLGESLLPVVGYVQVGGFTLSFAMSITVMVVLAMVIGLVILFVGLIVVKKIRLNRHVEEPIYQPPPYMSPNYRDPPPSYDKTPMAPKSTTLTLKPKSSNRCVLATQQQQQLNNHQQQQQQQQSGPREENGYTHIWQRPLPDKPHPEDHCLMMQQIPHEPNYEQHPGSVHYGYNSIESVPLNHCQRKNSNRGKTPGAVVAPSRGGCGGPSDHTNLMSLSSFKENRTGAADTRYFQLDLDRSNHVSA